MAAIKGPTGLADIIKSEFNEQLNNVIGRVTSKRTLNKLGKEARNQVVKRTRLGQGVTGQGQPEPLKPLKQSTKDYRTRYSKNLSRFTSKNKSNLTATGQFLDSMKYRVNPVNNQVELFFENNRRRELSGGPPRVKHTDLLEYVSKDRFFFDLTDFEIRKLQSIVFQAAKF